MIVSEDDSVAVYMSFTLRSMLNKYKKTLQPDHYDQVCRHVLISIRKYQNQFSLLPPGADRARLVHRLVDEAVAQDKITNEKSWKKVSCKSGCSACCYMRVEITEDEAALLKSLNVEVDQELQEKQRAIPLDKKVSRAIQKCLFLSNTGRCKVYEDRPATCRRHFVVDDPVMCEPTPSGNPQQVRMLGVFEGEIITSAALDMTGKCGSIPEMI